MNQKVKLFQNCACDLLPHQTLAQNQIFTSGFAAEQVHINNLALQTNKQMERLVIRHMFTMVSQLVLHFFCEE